MSSRSSTRASRCVGARFPASDSYLSLGALGPCAELLREGDAGQPLGDGPQAGGGLGVAGAGGATDESGVAAAFAGAVGAAVPSRLPYRVATGPGPRRKPGPATGSSRCSRWSAAHHRAEPWRPWSRGAAAGAVVMLEYAVRAPEVRPGARTARLSGAGGPKPSGTGGNTRLSPHRPGVAGREAGGAGRRGADGPTWSARPCESPDASRPPAPAPPLSRVVRRGPAPRHGPPGSVPLRTDQTGAPRPGPGTAPAEHEIDPGPPMDLGKRPSRPC